MIGEDHMEEKLMRLTPQGPPPDLKRRIIAAARRQARITAWDRLCGSRLFWCGSCAAIAVCLLLARTSQMPRVRAAPAPAEEAAMLARSLADMAGDGVEFERWLALRLSAGGGRTGAAASRLRILEEFKWPG